MDLGTRQIRTAGKGSGSIELTLPVELRDLVGVTCRLVLRDGAKPDIVLQPDLQRAQQAFAAVWERLVTTLRPLDADLTTFPPAVFSFGLASRPVTSRPFLCWRDGILLSGSAPHPPAAIAYTLAAMAQELAPDLAIGLHLASSFGAACGYVVTGIVSDRNEQAACDMAAAELCRGTIRVPAPAASADVLDASFWTDTAPYLRAVAELFVTWTADPVSDDALVAAWRREHCSECMGDRV